MRGQVETDPGSPGILAEAAAGPVDADIRSVACCTTAARALADALGAIRRLRG
jgi:hypothetical protein